MSLTRAAGGILGVWSCKLEAHSRQRGIRHFSQNFVPEEQAMFSHWRSSGHHRMVTSPDAKGTVIFQSSKEAQVALQLDTPAGHTTSPPKLDPDPMLPLGG